MNPDSRPPCGSDSSRFLRMRIRNTSRKITLFNKNILPQVARVDREARASCQPSEDVHASIVPPSSAILEPRESPMIRSERVVFVTAQPVRTEQEEVPSSSSSSSDQSSARPVPAQPESSQAVSSTVRVSGVFSLPCKH